MKFHDCTIQQIIPADGWKAAWEDLDNDNRDAYTKPLVCWALVEPPVVIPSSRALMQNPARPRGSWPRTIIFLATSLLRGSSSAPP